MKKITFLLLSIILFSCDEQVEEIQEKASLFTIYNKSSHTVDIIELRPTLGTVKNEYHIAVDDSVSILTPREEHIVPPFGSGEVYLMFDDTIKYNCVKSDNKMFYSVLKYKYQYETPLYVCRGYTITDTDYNIVVETVNKSKE